MVGNVTLKKTIDRLSRNLSCFTENDILIENYMDIVKDNTHSQFIYYALADGIFNILKKTREGIVAFLVPLKHPPSQQVTIFKPWASRSVRVMLIKMGKLKNVKMLNRLTF